MKRLVVVDGVDGVIVVYGQWTISLLINLYSYLPLPKKNVYNSNLEGYIS